MKLRKLSMAKFATMAIMVVAAVLVAACGSLSSDQNTFSPSGEVAQKQLDLFIVVLIPAVIILIGVFAAMLYIFIRFRRREGDGIPKQIEGNNRLEIGWTILPTILLMGLAVPTIMGIIELGGSPDDDALGVRVVAFQWDWSFEYTDPEYLDEEGDPFSTKDLYIPVDRDVNFVEAEQLVNALRAKKPELAQVEVYRDPPGGHTFNRQVDHENGYLRIDSPAQIDSWNRIWAFLEAHLMPVTGSLGGDQ